MAKIVTSNETKYACMALVSPCISLVLESSLMVVSQPLSTQHKKVGSIGLHHITPRVSICAFECG